MTSLSRLLLWSLATTSLPACHRKCDDPAPEAASPGLTGRWKLVARQCFCPAASLPDEEVRFTGTSFVFWRDGQPSSSGQYADTTAGLCRGLAPVPALHLTYASPSRLPGDAGFTLSGNTLVLDYGSPCDGPRDTYQRVR